MCRLANLFAAAHTFETAPRSFAAKSVKTSPLTDPARLPSKGAFLRRSSCDALRARRGTWSHRASLLDSVGFAANGPGTTLLRQNDPALLVQTRWFWLGPRSRPRITWMRALLWAKRSLSTSATSFQSTTHEHEFLRALSSLAAGGCPADVAAHDAFFTLPASSSLDAKKTRARCAAASYANFPDTRPREPDPEGPRAFALTSDTFQVGA